MSSGLTVAVLGLGETARDIATALQAAEAKVIGFDSGKVKNSPVALAETAQAAVEQADVVLSLNSATIAARTAESVSGSLKSGAIYADLNVGTPALKQKLAAMVSPERFVDVAVLESQTGAAEQPSMEVAGQPAARFIELLAPLGLKLTLVSERAGDAAARAMIRLLIERGLAAVAADTLWAANSLGIETWAMEQLKNEFTAGSEVTLQNLLDSTGKLAKPRSVELTNVGEMLAEAGYESTTLNGIGLTLSHVMHGRKIPFADLSED